MPLAERLLLEKMERQLAPLAGGLAHEVVQSEYRRMALAPGAFGSGEWESLVVLVSKSLERALGRDLPIGTRESLRKICGLTSVNPHF